MDVASEGLRDQPLRMFSMLLLEVYSLNTSAMRVRKYMVLPFLGYERCYLLLES